jgi:predicted amidohydrolase YtcJ
VRLSAFLAATLIAAGSLLQAQDAQPGDRTGGAPDTSPNLIFVHGDILTGTRLHPGDASPIAGRVSALAVTNSTIVAAGSDAELLKLRGPRTRVVDLGGAFVMPGFNDAHVHLAEAGQQRLAVDLDGTASLAEMLERIRSYTAKARPGQWIVGSGWDQTKWQKQALPTRGDLDQVTGGHPAVFFRTDGHIVVANSAALLAAGISSATQDPDGGKIDRDETGTPTGIVREAPAVALIFARVPPLDPDTRRKALDLALADAAAHGVTSLQDNSTWEDWLTLESMERTGALRVRVAEWLDFNQPVAILKERRASHSAADPMLHLTMLKAFMDGSLGSRTAYLAAPYSDDPQNFGLPRYDQQKLNQMASERAEAGFQLGFHAIGDEANTMALSAFDAAEQVGSPADGPAPPRDPDASIVTSVPAASSPAAFRFRVEHAQVLLPEDFDRFHRLGVIASMQPSHLLTDMAWAGARLGPERAPYAYAWRSMLDHHVRLAFGTDYPVESINPFRGLYAAVTRQNEAGTQTFHPEQRISIAEAIFAYTQGSAFAEFRESQKGRLEPGYLADFVVLDRDPTKVTPIDLLHTQVIETVVGGRIVYRNAAIGSPAPGEHAPSAPAASASSPAISNEAHVPATDPAPDTPPSAPAPPPREP